MIGGFFELEIPESPGASYHPGAIALASGRACLNLILRAVKPKKLYVPFYCCDTLLTPCEQNQVPCAFYEIGLDFSPVNLPVLEPGEYFLYINYFGLQQDVIERLYQQYGAQLIVDNTQGFFEIPTQAVWSFNSARKFFGVPDGAYLYGPKGMVQPEERNSRIHYQHLVERLLGNQESAYLEFLASEADVPLEPINMSLFSEKILNGVDYERVKTARQENYKRYHQALSSINQLDLPAVPEDQVPFYYPLLLERPIAREALWAKEIFIPTFWKEVLEREDTGYPFERHLAKALFPLPLDHRYNEACCQRVIEQFTHSIHDVGSVIP